MSYETMEQAYKQLNDEQQKAIYEMTLLLLNNNKPVKPMKERVLGKYAGKATAVFADDWEMTEEELCSLWNT